MFKHSLSSSEEMTMQQKFILMVELAGTTCAQRTVQAKTSIWAEKKACTETG